MNDGVFPIKNWGNISACHVSFPVEASLGKIFEGNVKLEKTQVLVGLWMNFSNATGLGDKNLLNYSYWRLLFIMGDIFYEDSFPIFWFVFNYWL